MTSKWWVWKQSLLQKVLSIFAERALGRGCEVLWEVSSWVQTWSGLNMVYDDFEVLGRPSRCGLIALISIKPYWILYTWFKWHKHFYQIYFQLSAWILPESSTVWKCVSKSSAKHVCLWIWWSWIIEKANEKWERGEKKAHYPCEGEGTWIKSSSCNWSHEAGAALLCEGNVKGTGSGLHGCDNEWEGEAEPAGILKKLKALLKLLS